MRTSAPRHVTNPSRRAQVENETSHKNFIQQTESGDMNCSKAKM
jgi:hypothetical protein